MSWGLHGVSVSYGDIEALDSVDLGLSAGQIAVVVGGDGAGKTTMCRALVGLVRVDAGEVTRPHLTCFQPETSGVWSDMTVRENLEFVAGAYGLSRDHARERIEELVEVTNLGDARDRLGSRLSGGMRQKLGVAMAVLSEPDLLVLDEPTTGLDPVSRLELWSFITRSARENRAVVVTTTYVEEAARGNTILALDAGRELASGSISEVEAAMPGRLYRSETRQGDGWHRGHAWRVWSKEGTPVPDAEIVEPDLVDVVTVAALAREQQG